MTVWTQRTRKAVADAAVNRAKGDPAARALKLHKRSKLVNWLLGQFGEGKVKVTQ